MRKIIIFLITLLLTPLSVVAQQPVYDIGISSSDISFHGAPLVIGSQIRLYAKINNYGQEDVAGYVSFFRSNQYIGDSQVVSVVAGGVPDEVYVDFVVPDQPFNIRAEIKGQTPQDENPTNDIALTGFFEPYYDNDGDGIPDNQDLDDDNDGLLDSDEVQEGTDPNNPDSDGDGVNDNNDEFPLDPSKSELPSPELPSEESLPNIPEVVQSENNSNQNTAEEEPSDNVDESQNIELESELTPEPIQENQEKQEPIAKEEDQLQPQVLIDVEKKDWRTYRFTPKLRGFTTENFDYLWDFGDGSTSKRPSPRHKYKGQGDYKVTLQVVDKVTGKKYQSKAKEVEITFFNLANYQLWLTLVGLLGGLVVFLRLLKKLAKKAFRSKQKAISKKTTKKKS